MERINWAIDHIVQNLDQRLKLEDIAKVACFSPFHFHRVFRLLVGETLNQFVKRLRLERALWMLSHQRPRSLTEIAMACGFASHSDFSRSFKKRYGTAPRAFDLASFRARRGADLKASAISQQASHRLDSLATNQDPASFEVQIRRLPARCVAYIRVLDPYRPGVVSSAAERLMVWAKERGFTDGQWLGYMWDDPEIVALKDCRYDIGLEVEHVDSTGEIGRFDFPAMSVAQVEVRGSIDLELRALNWLFGVWLPRSGFVPANHPMFEAWIGRPFQHGNEYFELSVQIPIEPSKAQRISLPDP